MKTIATKTLSTKPDFFGKTEAEYAELDKWLTKSNKLFAKLTTLADEGKKDSEEWKTLWEQYKVAFKKARGYNPLWAR